ncbi:MAG: amidohydrolase family protein [Acidobacteria bacterium]|nr:amidohydrolase family protein [Acidobacteriota bacterium]
MSPSRPTRYHAAWVLPVAAPPIRDGWVEVAGGVVTGIGRSTSAPRDTAVRRVRLPSHVVLPGLVNAHTHLELSGLRGAVPPAGSMPDWARAVMAGQSRLAEADGAAAVCAGVAEVRRAGTALVGDIANTHVSVEVLRRGPVAAVVFREALGFDADASEARTIAAALGAERAANPGPHVRVAVAAHAPYSVAPGLFRALAEAARGGPRSVHVAESAAELELLRTGTGAWRAILEERNRWHSGWTPPGTGPVAYLDALGWVGPDTLLVHGVHLTQPEIERIAAAGATLVACPRSNAWTGAGTPPLSRFYASGGRVAVGTDSLASVPDLNLFAELAAMRRLAPSVPASALIASATAVGAAALGAGDRFGAIAPSRPAALIAVELPARTDDVEEYLLSGIEPDRITWLADLDSGPDAPGG